jgi:hypothetical protein
MAESGTKGSREAIRCSVFKFGRGQPATTPQSEDRPLATR